MYRVVLLVVNHMKWLVGITIVVMPVSSFCLSPSSLIQLSESENTALIEQVMKSEACYRKKREEVYARIPDWAKNSQACVNEIQKSSKGRLFVSLSEIKVPSLWRKHEKQRIVDYIKERYPIPKWENSKKLVVVGAGPIGLIVSIELALLGHHITVIEKRPCYTRDSLLISFSLKGYPFIQQLFPPEIRVHLNQMSFCLKHLEEALKSVLEGVQKINPYLIFKYGEFQNAQYQQNGIRVFYSQKGKEMSLQADCLIGCDGAKSRVRVVAQGYRCYTVEKRMSQERSPLVSAVFMVQNNEKVQSSLLGFPLYQSYGFTFAYLPDVYNGEILGYKESGNMLQNRLNRGVQTRFLPIHLYAQYQPLLCHYFHASNNSSQGNRIYLLGESLAQFDLGTSFYRNLAMFYRGLPMILNYLSEGNWTGLGNLCQVSHLENEGHFSPVRYLKNDRYIDVQVTQAC